MNENQLIHKLIDVFEYKNSYQLKSSNIQPQDMYVLERIYFLEKVKIRDISKQYDIPPSTLTGIIDRLETKKYIERIRSTEDRRTIELIATELGKQVVKEHVEEDKLFSLNFFNTLQEDKKQLFKELLAELLTNVKKESLFNANNIY
ncbi:MarR family transcriptional regulator [Clostridium sp. HMP27]|uniref:MarR family winged helix-turn-helix transcriptional regulator n=1 Tax=Clostridium sp. HMP27 TaxID=1487921 RepID=UPI00052BE163|nr:MarR family transcriptional regulator [Clostridium sp. HMP27]KGK87537.1 transcriptional regulator [Clostridium sp. HMP27]